jgi:hypothetical protein
LFTATNGTIRRDDLVRLSDITPGGIAAAWKDALAPETQHDDNGSFVNLLDFFVTFCTSKVLRPLYGPRLWKIGTSFERVLGKVMQEKMEPTRT